MDHEEFSKLLKQNAWALLGADELQRLGGWSSCETVQRYSHLKSEQLQKAAERVVCTNLVHGTLK